MTKIRANLSNLRYLDRAQDFLDYYSFPKDLVEDVLRHPHRAEKDPTSMGSGYLIVRLIRGDITVVMGLRDPENPTVIYVYLNHPGDNVVNRKAGQGPGSKLPSSLRELRTWALAAGCKFEMGGTGHTKVFYKDQLIGTLPNTPSGGKRSIENAYSALRKQIAGVVAQQAIEEWRNR
jgi:hypothetical protein